MCSLRLLSVRQVGLPGSLFAFSFLPRCEDSTNGDASGPRPLMKPYFPTTLRHDLKAKRLPSRSATAHFCVD